MRKLFFIAVAGLIAMPLWAAEAPGTDADDLGQNAAISLDVEPWSEIEFTGDVAMTMPGQDHHITGATSVLLKTNDYVTLTLTGTDLTRVANDDGDAASAPALAWAKIDGSDPVFANGVGNWFATFGSSDSMVSVVGDGNVVDVDEGFGDAPEIGITVEALTTPEWWHALAGDYEATLTVTVTNND